jgi:hypothetical protein
MGSHDENTSQSLLAKEGLRLKNHVLLCSKPFIPGLQARPGMIEAGGIQRLYDVALDSCFRRNDEREHG